MSNAIVKNILKNIGHINKSFKIELNYGQFEGPMSTVFLRKIRYMYDNYQEVKHEKHNGTMYFFSFKISVVAGYHFWNSHAFVLHIHIDLQLGISLDLDHPDVLDTSNKVCSSPGWYFNKTCFMFINCFFLILVFQILPIPNSSL